MRLLTAITCFVLLICGCKENYDAPCRDSYIDYVNLNSTEELLWPFQSSDTLFYVNASNDIIRLVAAQFGSVSQNIPKPNNPECPDDSVGYEVRTATFADNLNIFTFTTSIRKLAQKVEIIIAGQTYSFNWTVLVNSDSATFDFVSFVGDTFANVFVLQGVNGDSLYYNTNDGIVRFKSASQLWVKCKGCGHNRNVQTLGVGQQKVGRWED